MRKQSFEEQIAQSENYWVIGCYWGQNIGYWLGIGLLFFFDIAATLANSLIIF